MRWCLLALLVGCAGEHEDAVDRMVTLDVVIAPNSVTLYADSPSADPGCMVRFPTIGGVVHVGDIQPSCEPSLFGCVDRITYAGSTYEPPAGDAPMIISLPPRGPTLILEGCGASATVALPLEALPSPPMVHGEIVYDTTNRVVDVGWNSDPRATSHLVTLGSSVWSEVHHVDSGDDRFTTPFAGALVTVVQSLLPGREQITSLGLVRLWPASEPTTFQLQAAPHL